MNTVSELTCCVVAVRPNMLLVREFKEVVCIGVHKMAIETWYRLSIDRVHMSLAIAKNDYPYGVFLGQLYEMKAMQSEILLAGKITICKKEYSTRLSYYPRKKGGKIADIEIGVTPTKHRYFRLGLYPSKFRGDDFSNLKGHLNAFFGHYFYDAVYEHSNVTYVELATDNLSHQKQSFIPYRSRMNKSFVYLTKDGQKGATYLGGVKSQVRYCFYDKAKQLIETQQATNHHHAIRTRIEARIRRPKLKPCELISLLPDPFVGLGIADLATARQLSKSESFHQFLDDCELNGSAAALAKCDTSVRKRNTKLLQSSNASWWKPGYAWGGLANAIAAIAP